MSDWEESKQNFIDKLGNADRIFDEIFKADSEGLVIQGEEREELKSLQTANKKILNKLKSREFTVAIVGLEKAGKSTLGNALIKSMVLPEYASRCTYTTTEIRAGNTDVAEVYFYNRDEFNKNFKRMLNDVQYQDTADFGTMTLETFVRYWKAVETDPAQRGIFLLHNGTTAEDIKTILAGKQKILPLLGQERKEFGAEYWSGGDNFNEFKTYITGMAGKNADGTVRREPYPYAVKNVIIRSTQLAEMSHIVLYDVPGFDSPTELHKRQTEEMLKEADAIILVTNAGDRPDLTAPQLDMLRKGQDLDGVKLNEKSFVFGNKIDRASNKNTARDNLAVLKNDAVNKYQITLGNHVVGGSARAYLEKIGLIAEKVASKVLDEWKTPDGVQILLDKMQDYYDEDRFEVLKRRAENTLSKTRTVLQNLLERYSSGELNYSDVSTEIIQDIQARLPRFTKEANRITQIHAAKIFGERPFTKALKDDVNNIYPLVEEAHLPLIESEEYELAIDPDGVYPTSKVDGNVRDKLGVLFVENIVTSTSKFTSERQSELRQALVDSFLQIMGMEATTNYKAELNESVNKLFDEMLVKGGAECNFNSLVERFVMTLIQTLITHPFATDERVNKVKEALEELVSLSVYYNMPTDKQEKNSLQLESLVRGGDKFFIKILAHEGIEVAEDIDASENENFLRELFKENRDQICKGASLAVELLPFGKWAKLLMKAGINLAQINADKSIKGRDKLDHKLEDLFYTQNWLRLPEEQRTQSIENAINAYAKAGNSQAETAESDSLMAQLDDIQTRAKKAKRMNGKDDMIATLDADILILRDITAKAVINAIGLERAFNSVITKNVNLINRHLNEPEGNAAYRLWIRNNAARLMPSRFEQIIEQGAVRENKKAIVNAIRNLLSKWD